MQTTALTAQLTDEFGYLVPHSMIESTVRSAAAVPSGATPDDVDVAATARTDVRALAEAMRRRAEERATR